MKWFMAACGVVVVAINAWVILEVRDVAEIARVASRGSGEAYREAAAATLAAKNAAFEAEEGKRAAEEARDAAEEVRGLLKKK
jgi:hypothetical protein